MRDVRITSLPTGAPPWRRAAWIALALLLAAAAVWWLYHRTGDRTGGGRAGLNTPFPVVASPVTTGDINITYNALGTVTPLATVTVRGQISGQITQIAFQEGQMVKQGDLLARDRSAALSSGARASPGHAGQGSLAVEAGASRSRALPEISPSRIRSRSRRSTTRRIWSTVHRAGRRSIRVRSIGEAQPRLLQCRARRSMAAPGCVWSILATTSRRTTPPASRW